MIRAILSPRNEKSPRRGSESGSVLNLVCFSGHQTREVYHRRIASQKPSKLIQRHRRCAIKWYKHDSNANCDAKLRKVRLKYGMEGYGLYWYCLELIAQNVEKHNLSFELEHDAEIISADVGIHFELVQEMMAFMVDLRLFEQENGIITCLKLAKRTDEYTQKIIKQLGHVPTNSRQSPDKVRSNRTEEKRLEQNRTEEKNTAPSAPSGFDKFKLAYPARTGQHRWKQAQSAINARLKEGHAWQEIIAGAKRYHQFCDASGITGNQYVMQAATFVGTEKSFLEPWHQPKKKSEVQQDKNIDTALGWLERVNEG